MRDATTLAALLCLAACASVEVPPTALDPPAPDAAPVVLGAQPDLRHAAPSSDSAGSAGDGEVADAHPPDGPPAPDSPDALGEAADVRLNAPPPVDGAPPPRPGDMALPAPDLPPQPDLPPLPPPPPPCGASDADGDGYGPSPQCAGPDCDDRNASVHPGAREACNGTDEDCDARIDEDIPVEVCGRGPCRRESACAGGVQPPCQPGAPAAESCNGEDDDCNGLLDDGLAPAACGVGACRREVSCRDGQMPMCHPGDPGVEICGNGEDEDCDGVALPAVSARTIFSDFQALGNEGTGCTADFPFGELCSAAIHRACRREPCMETGFGPIERDWVVASYTCVSGVTFASLTWPELAARHEACTGDPQRFGPNCASAAHRACQAMGFAAGLFNVETEVDRMHFACLSGDVASVLPVPFADLSLYLAECDGITQAFGPECMAAIRRWCVDAGHESGYGPVEYADGVAWAVCVRAEP